MSRSSVNQVTKSAVAHSETASVDQVNRTLEDAWRDAREAFHKKTNRPLVSSVPVDLDAYMEKWSKAYEIDPSEGAQRKRRFLKVVQNIIDGFQVVGGIVSEGASMAFAPAGFCFSALSFLLEMPRRIQNVYDTLLELFEEVENFLVRFKILKRIDSRSKLSADIVTSANKMLVSFVEICTLSIDLLGHHKLKTSLKAALLNNDSGTGSALSGFRTQAQSLDSLTSTVAFEHVVSIEETGRDTNVMVKAIVASTNDDKTRLVNQGRLNKIEEKIYARDERLIAETSTLWPHDRGDLLPDTLNVLGLSEEFEAWINPKSTLGRSALLLIGDHGTGKSRMLEALKEELDESRRTADKDESSLYVALHVFSDHATLMTDDRKRNSSTSSFIPTALRSMAVQVARQSTRYATDLEKQLSVNKSRPISQMDNIEELWDMLKLSAFSAPSNAIMYLLFDGIDRESESKVKKLLSLFVGPDAERQQKKDTLKVRAIFALDTKLHASFDLSIPNIGMDVLTLELIQEYAKSQLRRLELFQEADERSSARIQEVLRAIELRSARSEGNNKPWTFMDVGRKLKEVCKAVQNDASSNDLRTILEGDPGQTNNPEGKRMLEQVAAKIPPRLLSQINQMLPWVMYTQSGYHMEIEELEAILFLAQNSDSLQSLAQKMRDSFGELFFRSGQFVSLKPEVEDTLRQMEEEPLPGTETANSLITLDVSIRNAEEAVVRQFIWQLNEEMTSGRFNFASSINKNRSTIHVKKLHGHLTIAKLCLKILNEGWQRETEALVWYAREYLPKHFVYLNSRIAGISLSDRSIVSQGLVSFLNDPYHLEHDPDRHFGSGEYWISDTESRESVRSWLGATMNDLQAREKRWAEFVLDPSAGPLGFMEDMARSVARKWMIHGKYNARERDAVSGVRKSNSLEHMLFVWLDKFIQVNIDTGAKQSGGGATTFLRSYRGSNRWNRDARYLHSKVEEVSGTSIQSVPRNKNEGNPKHKEAQNLATNSHDKVVERALAWSQMNHVGFDKTGQHHINLGYTYLGIGQFRQAEVEFNAVLHDPRFTQQGFTGLGRAAYLQGNKDGAARLLREAIRVSTQIRNGRPPSKEEAPMFAELLRELAQVYEEIKATDAAVNSYERSLEIDNDLDTWWKTLKLLCATESSDRALNLLVKWAENSKQSGGKGLAQALFRSAHDDPFCEQLSSLIHAIRNEDLRTQIAAALSDAADIAANNPTTQARPGLLYLHGLAIARGQDKDRHQTAIKSWRNAIWSAAPESGAEFGFRHSLYLAAKGVALNEFEKVRRTLSADASTTMSREEKAFTIQQLQRSLETEALRNANVLPEARTVVNRFVIATHILLDQANEARQVSSTDMSNALEILRDDDADNDIAGIRILSQLLCSMGDKVGTLTAFSLLDRRRQSQEDHANSITSTNEVPPTQSLVADSIVNQCDSCRRMISSADPNGLWWCQYCADFDLCSECHRQFVAHNLNLPYCHPDHEFMHLYHTEYDEEEITHDMVRIDWEWKDLGNGKFAREGGRIVATSEWFEQLRVMWGLPEPQVGLRAQK